MKRRKGRFMLIVVAQVLATLLVMASRLPAQQAAAAQAVKQEVPNNGLVSAGPVQPIAYSHKVHLALGMQCQNCHTNPDPGKLMTYPATSACMKCHASAAKDKPEIKKLAEFANSQKPIPWVRVYALLPGYEWNHRRHLDAGVKCEACHGQVSQMDVVAEVTSVVSMTSCLDCHTKHNAKTACVTCHLYWSSVSEGKKPYAGL